MDPGDRFEPRKTSIKGTDPYCIVLFRWFFSADNGTSTCELSFEKAVQGLTAHLFGDVMFDTPGWPERARKLAVTGLGTLQR